MVLKLSQQDWKNGGTRQVQEHPHHFFNSNAVTYMTRIRRQGWSTWPSSTRKRSSDRGSGVRNCAVIHNRNRAQEEEEEEEEEEKEEKTL